MNRFNLKARMLSKGVLIAYTLIIALALIFDLLTDRSFGALMLSTMPIGLVAVMCSIVGPWLKRELKLAALRNWLIGIILVLSISLIFSSLGAEQAKTGELIFTYSLLLAALPSSLMLPIAMMWIEPTLGDNTLLRMVFAWTVCVVAGLIQWLVLNWLCNRFRN